MLAYALGDTNVCTVCPVIDIPACGLIEHSSRACLQTKFSEQRFLTRHVRLVTAAELREAALGRARGDRFPVAVTFDDDLPSHREIAMPLLERLGVPATFFLCGASLDAPFSFWWERLQLAADRGTAPSSFLEEAAVGSERPPPRSIHGVSSAIQTMSRADRQIVIDLLSRGVPDDGTGMPRADALALVGAGFEVGFHTLHHHPLPTLGDTELEEALSEGRDRLESLVGHELESVAYPHGRADARVASAARQAGFRDGFTVDPVAVGSSTDPLLMGRMEPAASRLGFALGLVRTLLGS